MHYEQVSVGQIALHNFIHQSLHDCLHQQAFVCVCVVLYPLPTCYSQRTITRLRISNASWSLAGRKVCMWSRPL